MGVSAGGSLSVPLATSFDYEQRTPVNITSTAAFNMLLQSFSLPANSLQGGEIVEFEFYIIDQATSNSFTIYFYPKINGVNYQIAAGSFSSVSSNAVASNGVIKLTARIMIGAINQSSKNATITARQYAEKNAASVLYATAVGFADTSQPISLNWQIALTGTPNPANDIYRIVRATARIIK
jgi:hypothetical protein